MLTLHFARIILRQLYKKKIFTVLILLTLRPLVKYQMFPNAYIGVCIIKIPIIYYRNIISSIGISKYKVYFLGNIRNKTEIINALKAESNGRHFRIGTVQVKLYFYTQRQLLLDHHDLLLKKICSSILQFFRTIFYSCRITL